MDGWPIVSVILPVRNEAAVVGDAIRSALNQAYPGQMELIAADGASTDGTRDVVLEIAATDSRVSVVSNAAGTTPAGLNAAIRAARGDVIVRIDAHSVLPDNYIRHAVETLQRQQADNVGGVQEAIGDGLVQRAIALAMSTPVGVGDARFHYGGEPGPVDTVYLGVFRREVFERVGLFDESLIRNQDYELNFRIRASGGIVWFEPGLRVRYTPRGTLRGLWSQYFQYGTWKRAVLKKHPGSLRPRQLAPPLLIIGLSLSAAATATPVPWVGGLLPSTYLTTLIVAAVLIGMRRRSTAAVLLPVVLMDMHIAWGVGFLIGRHDNLAKPTNQ